MNMLVILCGLPMIFWVWEAMLTVFACYCFGLAIYRKFAMTKSQATMRKQKGAWLKFSRSLSGKHLPSSFCEASGTSTCT